MQQHTIGTSTMFVLAHEFADAAAAKRAWERVEAKTKKIALSAVRVEDGKGQHPMVILLADDEKIIVTIVRRVAFGGEPVELEESVLHAFCLRRMRTAVASVVAGRVTPEGLTEHIQRRGTARARLRGDGTLTPHRRPQG